MFNLPNELKVNVIMNADDNVHVQSNTDEFSDNDRWLECGLCYGTGTLTEYKETWQCPACNGNGGTGN